VCHNPTTSFAEIVDGARWNNLLLSIHDASDVRQGYEWGELRRAGGWTPYRYAVFSGSSPIAAISALSRPLPWMSGSILYASRGPVCGSLDAATWRQLLPAVREIARRTGAAALRLSPRSVADDQQARAALCAAGCSALAQDWTLWNAPRIVMTLDIRPDEDRLEQRMRETTRRALDRAVAAGASLTGSTTKQDMARFHRLLVERGRRLRRPVQPLEFFERLRRLYIAQGQGCLLLASHGGRDLAGLVAVRFGRRAYLLYSAVDMRWPASRKLRPGTGLHWQLIRWAKASGCETLDWGGSGTHFPPRRDDPGFGVYDFKLGFGCRLEALAGYYDVVFRPGLYRVVRLTERVVLPLAWTLRARLS
jgi:lipid II:glycine glycyltransferase (peptidoglycan interpeptide bridge formation enzyme)